MILPALAPRRRTREAAFFGALTLFSFCLAACDGGGGEPNDSADERLRRAAELARNDQEVPAARLLVDGIERFSRADQARLHAYAARYYYSAGVVSDALRNAQRARDLGTDSTVVLYIIGDSLRRNRRLREARAVLESILQRDPSHSLAKLSLGSLMVREEDDPARALPLFQGYLEKPSSNPAVHEQALLEYGRALRAAKRYQEAADQFALLLERRPTDRSLYSELASTMYRMRLREHGRLFETIYSGLSEGAFEEAAEGRLKREGRAAQAIAQEALNLTERMHYLEAYRKHRRALSLDETDVRIPAYFAGFLNDLRRGRDAVAVLDRALEKRRLPSSGLWYSRGTVLTDLDDSRGALKAFEKAIESLREETSRGITGGFVVGQAVASRTRFALGRAYLNVGALAAATTLFDALARELPRAWEPSYWRGRIRLEEGNASAAAALFREARDRGGGSLPDLRYWNAVALSRSGRRQEAAQAFQQLIQNEPGRLESYEELAKLLPPGENRREVIAARDRVDRTRR
ncbi:MAG: tetratricopeptide repeat protein, partial [Planctomycetota bacterium]|nr:tetratricopeptide repeat protein [Planctomycetota bacterium]